MKSDISLGSSPLARGLHNDVERRFVRERIIPARAGFTAGHCHHFCESQDHPRSRGVYQVREGLIPDARGSSPLARGLPFSTATPASAFRIIPARAGFTPHEDGEPRASADHPRSRGVYRRILRPPRMRRRIIPARAGFTMPPDCLHPPPQDHPRSRGVYGGGGGGHRCVPGSSPLARGLRGRCLLDRGRQRIIPARAGFTGTDPRNGGDGRDHPRSRGVYGMVGVTMGGAEGSSPLARGLHVRSFPGAPPPRIIPARAGFTCGIRPRPWTR